MEVIKIVTSVAGIILSVVTVWYIIKLFRQNNGGFFLSEQDFSIAKEYGDMLKAEGKLETKEQWNNFYKRIKNHLNPANESALKILNNLKAGKMYDE